MPSLPQKRGLFRSAYGSSALLANGFKQYNCDCGGQIQRARPLHRDHETSVLVLRQQTFWQSLCFSSEDEIIAVAEIDIIVRALGLCCQEKIARSCNLCALQCLK